jgi:hypothetical protein
MGDYGPIFVIRVGPINNKSRLEVLKVHSKFNLKFLLLILTWKPSELTFLFDILH